MEIRFSSIVSESYVDPWHITFSLFNSQLLVNFQGLNSYSYLCSANGHEAGTTTAQIQKSKVLSAKKTNLHLFFAVRVLQNIDPHLFL